MHRPIGRYRRSKHSNDILKTDDRYAAVANNPDSNPKL